ncbi:MAG: histidinol-phosphatase HisJ family protein [Clostridia bacterium]|nr:histidinol-phosphatase HisJ family protein [Clostridia bacterium]
MSIKQNLHIHTTYADGKNSPEEIVVEAINRGFDSIGFSEHSYIPYTPNQNDPENKGQLYVEKTDAYKGEIYDLKRKYRDKIDVFCGMEFDFCSDENVGPFDYLIGSVHCLEIDGRIRNFVSGAANPCNHVNTYFNGNGMAFAKAYFEKLACLPQKKRFDIIGHFDVITRNNGRDNFIDVFSKEYLSLGFEAIGALKGKIPLFEINTGAIPRGYVSAPFPQMEFLKEFKRQGFGAVITSDCHDKNFLDYYFDESKKLLLEAGFKSKWVFTDDGFKEVEL